MRSGNKANLIRKRMIFFLFFCRCDIHTWYMSPSLLLFYFCLVSLHEVHGFRVTCEKLFRNMHFSGGKERHVWTRITRKSIVCRKHFLLRIEHLIDLCDSFEKMRERATPVLTERIRISHPIYSHLVAFLEYWHWKFVQTRFTNFGTVLQEAGYI